MEYIFQNSTNSVQHNNFDSIKSQSRKQKQQKEEKIIISLIVSVQCVSYSQLLLLSTVSGLLTILFFSRSLSVQRSYRTQIHRTHTHMHTIFDRTCTHETLRAQQELRLYRYCWAQLLFSCCRRRKRISLIGTKTSTQKKKRLH